MTMKIFFLLLAVFLFFVLIPLQLMTKTFDLLGGLHLSAFLYGFIAIFFLIDPQAKAILGRGFRYIFSALIFLVFIHLSELILETWGLLGVEENMIELIEHILFGLAMVSFGFGFYLQSLVVAAKQENG